MKLSAIFVTAGAVLTLALPLLAQTPAPAPTPAVPTAKKPHHGPYEHLNLTADQKAKLKAINQDTHKQVKAVKSDTTLTPEQQKAKVKDIHAAAKKAELDVLTPEQKKLLAEERAEAKKNRRKIGVSSTPKS